MEWDGMRWGWCMCHLTRALHTRAGGPRESAQHLYFSPLSFHVVSFSCNIYPLLACDNFTNNCIYSFGPRWSKLFPPGRKKSRGTMFFVGACTCSVYRSERAVARVELLGSLFVEA